MSSFQQKIQQKKRPNMNNEDANLSVMVFFQGNA